MTRPRQTGGDRIEAPGNLGKQIAALRVCSAPMTSPPGSAPDAGDDLACPLCGYDLRGLPEHRCPECGHAFDPDELRRAKLEKREWFYEHATRRRGRAFLATAVRTLRPLRFWTRVAASTAIVPSRLKWWARSWILIVVLTIAFSFAASVLSSYVQMNTIRRTPPPGGRTFVIGGQTYVQPANTGTFWIVPSVNQLTLESAIERTAVRSMAWRDVPLAAAVFAWPVAAVLALQLFGITLRRAGIRRGHLWRCVLYPWPMVALPMVFLTAASFSADINQPNFYNSPAQAIVPAGVPPLVWQIGGVLGFTPTMLLGLFATIALSTIHLTAAHLRYLRLPQAALQALLVQTVAWLSILAVIYITLGGA